MLAINHLHNLYQAAGHNVFEPHCETVRQDGAWLSDCWEAVSEWSFAIRVTDDGEVDLIAGEVPVPDKPGEPLGPPAIA